MRNVEDKGSLAPPIDRDKVESIPARGLVSSMLSGASDLDPGVANSRDPCSEKNKHFPLDMFRMKLRVTFISWGNLCI
jgi:hypothetical protein